VALALCCAQNPKLFDTAGRIQTLHNPGMDPPENSPRLQGCFICNRNQVVFLWETFDFFGEMNHQMLFGEERPVADEAWEGFA